MSEWVGECERPSSLAPLSVIVANTRRTCFAGFFALGRPVPAAAAAAGTLPPEVAPAAPVDEKGVSGPGNGGETIALMLVTMLAGT